MEKVSNFNKKQENEALQWAIVVNAFISYLFLLVYSTPVLEYKGECKRCFK